MWNGERMAELRTNLNLYFSLASSNPDDEGDLQDELVSFIKGACMDADIPTSGLRENGGRILQDLLSLLLPYTNRVSQLSDNMAELQMFHTKFLNLRTITTSLMLSLFHVNFSYG